MASGTHHQADRRARRRQAGCAGHPHRGRGHVGAGYRGGRGHGRRGRADRPPAHPQHLGTRRQRSRGAAVRHLERKVKVQIGRAKGADRRRVRVRRRPPADHRVDGSGGHRAPSETRLPLPAAHGQGSYVTDGSASAVAMRRARDCRSAGEQAGRGPRRPRRPAASTAIGNIDVSVSPRDVHLEEVHRAVGGDDRVGAGRSAEAEHPVPGRRARPRAGDVVADPGRARGPGQPGVYRAV